MFNYFKLKLKFYLSQELFDKINGVVRKTQPEEPEEEVDERKRGYNSCFNPKFQAAKERRRNSEY